MKNTTITSALFVSLLLVTSCAENKEEVPVKEVEKTETVKATPEEEVATLTVEEIDVKRSEIEALEIEAVALATTDLREKLKQKWSTIHFYAKNGKLVKVKTYPHASVSKRTEEFYADETGLILVVIEDNGEGEKGKSKNEIDKMYYFNNGKVIQELNKEKAAEYTIKESDAEELLAEFNEYMDLFNNLEK